MLASISSRIPHVSIKSDCVAAKSSKWLCDAFDFEKPGWTMVALPERRIAP